MSPARLSKTEEAARLALAFVEAFNRRDVEGLARLFREDCLYHSADSAQPPCVGKESVARFWREFFAAFPQARMEAEEIFGLGGRCVLLWKSATMKRARGAEIFELREGAIYRHFSYVKENG